MSGGRTTRTTGPIRIGRFAVIDVGSHTARLAVYEVSSGGGFRVVFRAKEVPHLGRQMTDDGCLSRAAMDRGLPALERFARHLDELGNPPTRAVATSAVRDAPNREVFLRSVQRKTGLSLRVLTGEEEAHYAYLGVAAAWPLDRDLIADLGGGSLQLVRVREGRYSEAVSLPLGVQRLSDRYFEHDPPLAKERRRLREEVEDRLSTERRLRHVRRLIGVGGTARALARAVLQLREYPIPQAHGFELHRHDLDALAELVGPMASDRRRALPGIGRSRAEVLPAGLETFQSLLDWTGLDRILVSGHGIREGILVEFAGIPIPADADRLLDRSLEAIGMTFGPFVPRHQKVRQVAERLFDRVARRNGWGDEERLALATAAVLHDLGRVVDDWNQEDHASYLLRHLPHLGLSHRAIGLAALAVAARDSDLPEGWRREWRPLLDDPSLKTAALLGRLVRVATALTDLGVGWKAGPPGRRLRFVVPRRIYAAGKGRFHEKVLRPLEDRFGLSVEVVHG